jgi:hypothetical protein
VATAALGWYPGHRQHDPVLALWAHYQTVFQTGIGMVRSITPAVLKKR